MFSFLRRPKRRRTPGHFGYQPTVEALEERRLLADLRAVIVDNPDPVIAGKNITYRVTVANNTGTAADATNVVLTDEIPENMTFAAITVQPAGWSCEAPQIGQRGTITCTRDTLAFGQWSTLSFVLKADSSLRRVNSVTNTVSVTSDTPDSSSSNNMASATTAIREVTDLRVVKMDVIDPIAAGQNQTYRITVVNKGPSDTRAITLDDVTPTFTTFKAITVTPEGWTCSTPPVGGTGTIRCTKQSLKGGSWDTFAMVMRVNPGTPAGTDIINTASVGNPAYSSTTSTEVQPVNAQQSADLAVLVEFSDRPVFPPDFFSYIIRVSNSGLNAATNPKLTVSLPSGYHATYMAPDGWVKSSNSTGDFVFTKSGTFAAGETAEFGIDIYVSSSVPAGTQLATSATVSSLTPESSTTPSNNAFTHMQLVAGD